MADFWDEWEGSDKTPLPAGVYNMVLVEASVEYQERGPRTSLAFAVCDGEPYATKRVWLDWPHMPDKFGWLARKVWTALGRGGQRPDGSTPEEVMLTVGRVCGEYQGRTFRITVDVRPKPSGGEKNRVSDLELLHTGSAQQPAAADPQYGGRQEPAPWSS